MAARSKPGLARVRKKVAHRQDKAWSRLQQLGDEESRRVSFYQGRARELRDVIDLLDVELEALNDEQEDQNDRGE